MNSKLTLMSLMLSIGWRLTKGVETGSATLSTACNDLSDGEQYIRMMDGTYMDSSSHEMKNYPNVLVKCNSGWTIMDYSLDSSISSYFTSFSSWTEYAASSSLSDRVTWVDWFLPYKKGDMFALSPDCSSCEMDDQYGSMSSYFMTGNYIGCVWITKGVCDMDSDTLECYECTSSDSQSVVYSGLCTHMVLPANYTVYTDHDYCTMTSLNAVPSLGTNGQYCMCYKPSSATTVTSDNWNTTLASTTTVTTEESFVYVDLYNGNFVNGTYRITQPGVYRLLEDITLNMNAPTDWSEPNGENAWWPHADQNSIYEGATGFVGAYSMGFFAGICVESSNVTIDLNGFEMRMSEEFRMQQRWFSIIEIGSKAFISGQGPGNFGAFLTKSDTIVIKNGKLGLSSHHGIHGNGAKNIIIRNVHIYNFEVAGIAMNGFTNLIIEDVEIGPSSTTVPVLGVYTQARIMLPRLRAVIDANPTGTVKFSGRQAMTLEAVEEKLEEQMDLIFDYAMGIRSREAFNASAWHATRKLFMNELQIPSASTVYGIFLNSEGASVFALAGAPGYSYNATLKNVYIHDLINDPWEVPRLMQTKGPMNDIFDATRVTNNGLVNKTNAEYLGSVYTDAQYGLYHLSKDWSILSHSAFKKSVRKWIEGNRTLSTSINVKCNNDIMLHVTKGIFGLRLDSITGFELNNVIIENIDNIGVYGSEICGHYTSMYDGGHLNQFFPLQSGYTGTESHGLTFVNSKQGKVSNIKIKNIISARGDAFGVQFFPGNELTMSQVLVSDIHSGAFAKSTDGPFRQNNTMPNKIPRACAVSYWYWYDATNDKYGKNNITMTSQDIQASCITGHLSCDDSEFDFEVGTMSKGCSMEKGNLIDQSALSVGVGHVYEMSNLAQHAEIVGYLKSQIKTRGVVSGVVIEDTKESKKSSKKKGSSIFMKWVRISLLIVCVLMGAWLGCIGYYGIVCMNCRREHANSREKKRMRALNEIGEETPLIKKYEAQVNDPQFFVL